MMGREQDTARVLEQLVAAWNRGDVAAVVALFSETGVFIGAGMCKGCPCVGRAQFESRLVAETLAPLEGKLRRMSVSRVSVVDNRVRAHWVLDNWSPHYGGECCRGWLTLTVEDGQITYYRIRYDLNDPETIKIRTVSSDVIFGLSAPGDEASSAARVLLSAAAPGRTAVCVYIGDPEAPPPVLSARIREQLAAGPGRVVFELSDVVDGQSESMIDIERDVLLSGRYWIELCAPEESTPIACGRILDLRSPERLVALRERLTGRTGWPDTAEGDQRVADAVITLEKTARHALATGGHSDATTALFDWSWIVHTELDEGLIGTVGRLTALAALSRWLGLFAMLPTIRSAYPGIDQLIADERRTIDAQLAEHGADASRGPGQTRWDVV